MHHSPQGRARWGVLALLWLAGIYMRLPVLIAAPLGPRIGDAFALHQTGLGTLTTLPVLMLGLGALPAAWLIGRFGARATLIGALVLAAGASALRGAAPGFASLCTFTAATGLGIAAMQPALPALVGRWCPGFVALGSAVYMNGMMLGEFLGAGLTLPVLLPLAGGDWRVAIALISLPVILIAPLLRAPRLYGPRADPSRLNRLPDWRDPATWRLGLLLGTTASTFFGLNAYMGDVLAERGAANLLGSMLFAFNLAQLVASLLMMGAARRILRIPRLFCLSAALHVIGIGGFVIAGGAALFAPAVLLSFASALQLIAAVTLPPLAREPEDAGRMAAGMFGIGYVLAFVLPLIAGMLADAGGHPDAVLWFFLGCNVLCLPLAWRTPTLADDH